MQSLWNVAAWVVTHDFCPWANAWCYWVKKPIAILAVAFVAAIACAVFVNPVALISGVAILGVIGLGYGWPAVSIRGLTAQLRFHERRVSAGESVRASVSVRNVWPWPVWGICLTGDFGTEAVIALARVAGWSVADFSWEFVPTCRGEYPRTPVRLVTAFPFGLREASCEVVVERPLIVWPDIVPLGTLLDAAETRPTDDTFAAQRVGDSGDMAGTRPFRNGDSLRRVHWAQTARTGAMVVCERESPVLAAVRVVFDSDPAVHDGDGTTGTLEWSIRIAASVCSAYHRHNARVECCFGHETIPVAPGPEGRRYFLDRLARFQPCRHEAKDCQHEHAAHVCRRIHHRDCGVFQITITTARGTISRTEHRHVHGDQLWIVLDPQHREDRYTMDPMILPGRVIRLAWGADPRESFLQAWRSICRAG